MLNCLKCFDFTVFLDKNKWPYRAALASCDQVLYRIQNVQAESEETEFGFQFETFEAQKDCRFVIIAVRVFSRPQLLNFKTARSCPAGQSDERPLMVLVRMRLDEVGNDLLLP